jgi:uncharacterized membrane protein
MQPSRFLPARIATLAIWTLLIATLTAWHAWSHAAPAALVLWLLTVLPLLVALPGLWQGRRRTYRWAGLTLAPALAWGLTEMLANAAAGAVATATALLAFLALAALVAALRVMPSGR